MKIAEVVNEAGMGHIYQQAQKGPFIIMSGWRAMYSRQENRQRNAELRQRLFTDYGLASIQQQGNWPIEHDQDGNHVIAGKEDCLFIPMHQPKSRIKHFPDFLSLARMLMGEYDQDGIIVSDGHRTHLLTNPEISNDDGPEFEPETSSHIRIPTVDRRDLGNTMRVYGKGENFGDAPAWSRKGNYRYTITDKDRANNFAE